ncbi:hypothetical protein ACB094_08G017200 [Castanea mollissima]
MPKVVRPFNVENLLPVKEHSDNNELNLTAEFELEVHVSDACSSCRGRGGICLPDCKGKFYCHHDNRKSENKMKINLLLGFGVVYPVISIIFLFIIRRHYKKKSSSSNLLARNIFSDPSSRSDVEGGSVYFGVPVFSYSELEEATNSFDIEKEIGDGGFGTVYHGKLQDGREVAVKRLYGHNYRRVQQFINEVEILTRLRHKNLVSLYGCTSRHCRELLLVYEYIPNGTVADHIHGNRATPGSLTWPTRMRIAIETASALAYLHASDIIHRDIKTNNILLDDNFFIKVADFGLSRLFPNDASHVSTSPQAVDIFRHKHEINLANFAKNKIEKSAFHELIDPHLGFESDDGVRTMTILVAKLAFQCLQQDKEVRPSMDEVLVALEKIQCGDDVPEQSASPHRDEVGLLKNKRLPLSPEAVTDNWTSRSATPNVSG